MLLSTPLSVHARPLSQHCALAADLLSPLSHSPSASQLVQNAATACLRWSWGLAAIFCSLMQDISTLGLYMVSTLPEPRPRRTSTHTTFCVSSTESSPSGPCYTHKAWAHRHLCQWSPLLHFTSSRTKPRGTPSSYISSTSFMSSQALSHPDKKHQWARSQSVAYPSKNLRLRKNGSWSCQGHLVLLRGHIRERRHNRTWWKGGKFSLICRLYRL